MIIVFIDWYIKPDKVDEFLTFWKQEAKIENRNGLIGEFLSKPADIEYKSWITWHMATDIFVDSCTPETQEMPAYERFINIGLWMNEKDFEDAVAKYFNDNNSRKDFEAKQRRRALLTPQAWRIGQGKLPGDDSEGVK